MSGEWSDQARVADYLAREIPHRRIAEEMLVQALPERVERCIDLGTGDGRLLALVRGRYPDAEAMGLDSSAPMLERARGRFGGAPGVELREHDLRAPLAEPRPAEAVVSGLAIHHLEDSRKRELFEEITACSSRAGSSRTSISCGPPPRACTSASAARSAGSRTTRPTGSRVLTSRWAGCGKPASPRWTATSSGWS